MGAPDHLHTWPAMGTRCRAWLVGDGAEDRAHAAERIVADLEARWSRFLPDSDLSRLNRAGGAAVPVAPDTIAVLEDAITWWRATDGSFDPTVLPALEAAGYDRDRACGHGPVQMGSPSPGCAGIEVDAGAGTVRLPPGVRIDLGGIGKGRAVDLLAGQLGDLAGGLIDLGGDLRVWGDPPHDAEGWAIAIEDLRDGSTAALLGLSEGAVATSSTLRRTWRDGAGAAHHLIDPRTGRPTGGAVVSVSVVAGIAAAAEVLAKAAIVAGSVDAATAMLAAHGVPALVVPVDGAPVPVGELDSLCWALPLEER